MTPAQAAHLRLMETLPVRTHRRPEPMQNLPRPGALPAWKEERIREMDRDGVGRKEIQRQLHVGQHTVFRILGPVKAKK